MSTGAKKPERIPSSEIRIVVCDENDSEELSAGLYACFPDSWFADMEPPALRPPLESTRHKRQADRVIRPSFSLPHVHWLKAVYIPTNQFIGSAAWIGPGAPVHNFWRHSAAAFYNWREQFGWSESDIEEMWKGVNIEAWEKKMGGNGDPIRQKVMGDEPHWYLAPLYVLPDFQGRGVASLLLDWAIQRADATTPPTPMYLESSPRARKIYEHVGFVPIGDANFLRRGPPAWEPKKSVLHEHEPAKEKGLDVRVQEVVAGAPPL